MLRFGRSAILISTVLFFGVAPSMPLFAQFQNPIQAAKDAYNKAKAQQKQQQKPSQTPAQPQGSSAQPAPASTSPSSPGDSAAPWVPPSDSASAAAPTAAPVKLDPSKLPDILGIHLGMTAQEALAAAHKAYPEDMFVDMKANFWPTAVKPDSGFNIHSRAPGNFKDLSLSFTAPPGQQTLWKIDRMTQKLHTNRNTLIAALRQKYGKESYAWGNNDSRVRATNDNQITQMLWLYDEQGNHLPMPDNNAFTRRQSLEECTDINGTNEPVMPKDADWANRISPWCAAHFVALIVNFSPVDIVEYTTTTMMDVPLAIRTARAGDAWLRDYANKMHQEDLQRSKENKPAL